MSKGATSSIKSDSKDLYLDVTFDELQLPAPYMAC